MAELQPFRRVLVMGATMTGKSTLLSKAICGEFDEYYTPTVHAQTFYDCKRRLELIDCPGVNDAILTPDFGAFKQDVLVSKMLSNQDTGQVVKLEDTMMKKVDLSVTDKQLAAEEKRRIEEKNRANPMAGPDGNEINTKLADIYVIVYTPDNRSKYIARALKRAIRQNQQPTLRTNPIFFVLNESTVERPPHPSPKDVKIWEDVAARASVMFNKVAGTKVSDDDERKKQQWNANFGKENVKIMCRIFAADDQMEIYNPTDKEAQDSNEQKDYGPFRVRADTGKELHQLFDYLSSCALPAPPKRYAMGSGESTKKSEKRDTCSIDSCIIM